MNINVKTVRQISKYSPVLRKMLKILNVKNVVVKKLKRLFLLPVIKSLQGNHQYLLEPYLVVLPNQAFPELDLKLTRAVGNKLFVVPIIMIIWFLC